MGDRLQAELDEARQTGAERGLVRGSGTRVTSGHEKTGASRRSRPAVVCCLLATLLRGLPSSCLTWGYEGGVAFSFFGSQDSNIFQSQ